jgi:hypothetical protein
MRTFSQLAIEHENNIDARMSDEMESAIMESDLILDSEDWDE